MIERILNSLGLGDGSLNSAEWRRRHARHPGGQQAEAVIGSNVYNIRDWSLGGAGIDATTTNGVSVGDEIDMHLRFRLLTETVEIDVPAKIVRAENNNVAVTFPQLSQDARRRFEKVIDGVHAQAFLESQPIAA